MGQYQTFVVRFWVDDTQPSVRGHIQHIGSKRGFYFHDVETMLQFMRDHLGLALRLEDVPSARGSVEITRSMLDEGDRIEG